MPSFKIIGLLVLEKKIFKVFTIYGHGGHLGYVTWTIYINFRSPFQRRLQGVSEEKMFDQRTNGPVNAHEISWPSKAQNIQNLKNIW